MNHEKERRCGVSAIELWHVCLSVLLGAFLGLFIPSLFFFKEIIRLAHKYLESWREIEKEKLYLAREEFIASVRWRENTVRAV